MSQGRTLYDCYKNPSAEKIAKWEQIEQEIMERGGYAVNVSANTFKFTVRYMYRDNEDIEHYVYISSTKHEDYKRYTTAIYIGGRFIRNAVWYMTSDDKYLRRTKMLYNKLKKWNNDVMLVTFVKG